MNTIIPINLDEKKVAHLEKLDPREFFSNRKNVGEALLQALIDNDTDAFMEILDTYLRVNKSRVSKAADITRSTVQLAFKKSANPTLRTIAKIVHHETQGKIAQTAKHNKS